VAKTVPVKELRADLADLLDQVADRREHVIVTRHGRPAAAIVPIDEYDALEETAEILSDRAALTAIQRGRTELKAGKSVTLDKLRAEVRRRRK
jgi:prevent-host-death family protein